MDSSHKVVGSLADLARLSGLSTSTVSRALAGNPAIKKETRDRITALAREHGYRPNVVGRNLRTGKTHAAHHRAAIQIEIHVKTSVPRARLHPLSAKGRKRISRAAAAARVR